MSISRSITLFVLLMIGEAKVFAHIVITDTALYLIAEPQRVRGELWVPISGMVAYKAASAGPASQPATNPSDPEAFARAAADEVLNGLKISFGGKLLKGKVTDCTIRNLNVGLTDDLTPIPMAVYSVEFVPESAGPSPPEIVIEQKLLPMPVELFPDHTVRCLVKFRQSDQVVFRSEVLEPGDRATFKCQWP